MATAISFVSESSDHYLSLFENKETIEEIIDSLKRGYGDEFQYLYVNKCVSTDHNVAVLGTEITKAVATAYQEEGEDE